MDDQVGLLSNAEYDDISLDDIALDIQTGQVTNTSGASITYPRWFALFRGTLSPDKKRLLKMGGVLAFITISILLALSRSFFHWTRSSLGNIGSNAFVLKPPHANCLLQAQKLTWVLTHSRSSSSDKNFILTNGQSPGPTIEACRDQTVTVSIKNELDIDVALHWHGISQDKSNAQDGVPFVTQMTIAQHQTFEYVFVVNRAGTFWWHAHSGLLRLDGAYGALIVHSEKHTSAITQLIPERENNLTDFVLLVGDTYTSDLGDLTKAYLDGANAGLIEPLPDSIIINGQIRRATTNLEYSLPKLDIKTRFWRLRIINVGALADLKVRKPVKADSLIVVEADSTLVSPVSVTSLNIAVGQRYSLLLDTDDYDVAEAISFMIELDLGSHGSSSAHAHGHSHSPRSRIAPRRPRVQKSDLSIPPQERHLHDGQLHPMFHHHHQSANNSSPNLQLQLPLFALELGMDRRNGITKSIINSHSYIPQNHPINQEYPKVSHDTNVTGFSTKYSPDILTLSILRHEEVLILFRNHGGGAHPMHIHGHLMQVLATDSFFFDPTAQGPAQRVSRVFDRDTLPSILRASHEGTPLERPIWRDTMNVASDGWTLVKVRGSGKGVWSLHCHNAWHEMSGMAMILEVR